MNFAFSKYFTDGIRTKDEKRELPNVHDEVHEHMQNMIARDSALVINKRSRTEKRFEPTGWLTSMMTGAISKLFAASSKGLKTFKRPGEILDIVAHGDQPGQVRR